MFIIALFCFLTYFFFAYIYIYIYIIEIYIPIYIYISTLIQRLVALKLVILLNVWFYNFRPNIYDIEF